MSAPIDSDLQSITLSDVTFVRSADGFKGHFMPNGASGSLDDESAKPEIEFEYNAETGILDMKNHPAQGVDRPTVGVPLGTKLGPTEAMTMACLATAAYKSLLEERHGVSSIDMINVHNTAPNSNFTSLLLKEVKAATKYAAAPPSNIMEGLAWVVGDDLSSDKISASSAKEMGLPQDLIGSIRLDDPANPENTVFLSEVDGQFTGKTYLIEQVDPNDPTETLKLGAFTPDAPLLDVARKVEGFALKGTKKKLPRLLASTKAQGLLSKIAIDDGHNINIAKETARKLLGTRNADEMDSKALAKRTKTAPVAKTSSQSAAPRQQAQQSLKL